MGKPLFAQERAKNKNGSKKLFPAATGKSNIKGFQKNNTDTLFILNPYVQMYERKNTL